MTALNPAAHTIPEGEELVPTAKAPKATEASIALRQKSIWASLIAAVIADPVDDPDRRACSITSFRPAADIRQSGWWTVFGRIPSFTLENYKQALFGGTTDLGSYFVNSLVITIPAVMIPISIACMAAYGFAWMKFRGPGLLFVAVFALQIVPIQVTLIPLLTLFVDVGPGRDLLAHLDRAHDLRACRWRSSCCTTS